jgi:hypothetical protein
MRLSPPAAPATAGGDWSAARPGHAIQRWHGLFQEFPDFSGCFPAFFRGNNIMFSARDLICAHFPAGPQRRRIRRGVRAFSPQSTAGKYRSGPYRAGYAAPAGQHQLLANGESKEGNTMLNKATSTRIVPTRSSRSKTPALHITSESIASDLVAFRKQGGRIEVLGHTPLRANPTAFSSKGNTQHKKAQRKTAPVRPGTFPAQG